MLASAHSLLERTEGWRDWRSALVACLANEALQGKTGKSPVVCIDTSEVVEYLLPRSFDTQSYPTRLDLATNLLLSTSDKLFILPPHAKELAGVRATWHERARVALVKLRQLYEDFQDSRVRLERALSEDADKTFESLITALMREGPNAFGGWIGPIEKIDRVLARISSTLHIANARAFGISASWQYHTDSNTVSHYFERLQDIRPQMGNSASKNLVDALALDLLNSLNESATSETVVVLITHSPKILALIELEEFQTLFAKRGVPTVQPTEVRLAGDLQRTQGQGWLVEETLSGGHPS